MHECIQISSECPDKTRKVLAILLTACFSPVFLSINLFLLLIFEAFPSVTVLIEADRKCYTDIKQNVMVWYRTSCPSELYRRMLGKRWEVCEFMWVSELFYVTIDIRLLFCCYTFSQINYLLFGLIVIFKKEWYLLCQQFYLVNYI